MRETAIESGERVAERGSAMGEKPRSRKGWERKKETKEGRKRKRDCQGASAAL